MPDSDVPRERTFEKRAVDGSPQGRVRVSENRRTLELFEPADASTTMHLMSDLWFDELMQHDASLSSTPERLKHDLQIVLHWLGVKTLEQVGTEQRQQWARAFERYLLEGNAPSASLAPSFKYFREQLQTIYHTPDVLGPPLTDGIRDVFDRMLATDEDIANKRTAESVLSAAPIVSRSSIDKHRNETTHCSTPDSISSVHSTSLIAKGVAGFASGFILMFGLEVLLFSGMEFLSGHRLRPMGAGWIVLPIVVGCGGWILFRGIDFSKMIGADHILAEFGRWPREHQIALAIVAAIGWIGGVLIGYFVSIASGADYYPRTLGTWLLGRWDWSSYSGLTVRYFPWASLAWGFVGGALGAAIVYAKQLLRF